MLGLLRELFIRPELTWSVVLSDVEKKRRQQLDTVLEAEVKHRVQKWTCTVKAGRSRQVSTEKTSVDTMVDSVTFNNHSTNN